jgi:hypothetical protein
MQIVPLAYTASQRLTIRLGGQVCQITVRQRTLGVFLSLAVSNVPVVDSVLCLNGTLIVRDAYLGFVGDLAFYDKLGVQDPDYTGLGDDGRFFLIYAPDMSQWQFYRESHKWVNGVPPGLVDPNIHIVYNFDPVDFDPDDFS